MALSEIHLAFFLQCDEYDEHKGILNQKLFRNCLNRFSIDSTKVVIQFREPTKLQFNLDEEKVKIKIYEELTKLTAHEKLEHLHLFYFGRYWWELDKNMDLEELDEMAEHVHFSAMEMRKYGEILESDMLKFYSGIKQHKISLNDSLDEFYGLSLQTKKKHIPLHQKMNFVKFGSFLATRNSKSNEAINIINQIARNHVSRFDIGFIMGDRKIDVSKEALDEIEAQTGLVLNNETAYDLYDCYMKTSVVRYQKLRNGARSMFDSKRSIKREDSGIVEDGTEEEISNIYQNPDFERQEAYAMLENVIKNPEMIESFKKYRISAVVDKQKLEQNCRKRNMVSKETRQKVKINESHNIVYELNQKSATDEYAEDYNYAQLPWDKYGSAWGSYYHDHPYVGRLVKNDYSGYGIAEHGITSSTKVKKRKTFLLDKLRERKIKKRERQATSRRSYNEQYIDPYGMTNIGDEYFDDYEEVLTWIQKWTFRVEKFFQRTKTLRNIRLFWQQILFSIFFILG